MNNLQFKFNLVVSLSISALGALITQIDAAGIGLLSVGLMLTLLSLLTKSAGKQKQSNNKPLLLSNTLSNALPNVLPKLINVQNPQAIGQAQCK